MVKMIERSKRLEHNLGVISAPATDPGELSKQYLEGLQYSGHCECDFIECPGFFR